MNYMKRLVGILLAVLMIFVYMPSFAFAEGGDADTNDQIQTEEPDKSKDDAEITEEPESAEVPAAADLEDNSAEEEASKEVAAEKGVADSGTCGDNVTWSLDSSGVLTIKGTGLMDNYNSDEDLYTPWSGYSDDIVEVIVKSGVTGIGDDAFYGCRNIERVTLPASVKSIGNWAFYQCTGLTDITIPAGVTSIGEEAFYACVGLTGINIPEKLSAIEYGAFGYCRGFTDITIPNGVTRVEDYAFYGCESLTDITFSDSVTYIGDYVLDACDQLMNVRMPASVTHLGEMSFNRHSNLTSINIPYGVTTIEAYSFSYCSSLKSVSIPDSVTRIGSDAFFNCTSLQNTTIPNSVTRIDDNAFADCTSFTSIYIPDSVTYIGDYAISGCENLTSIRLPDNLTYFGPWRFANYSGLTSFDIPDAATVIADQAFWFCSGLTEIIIPDNVTSIGNGAFYNCTSLSEITIPASVTSIADNAFDDISYDYIVYTTPGSYASTYFPEDCIRYIPEITSQPEAVSVYDGQKATFKVAASGSGLKYQWQWKSGSKAWANTTLTGYNTDTLSFTSQAAHDGRQYRCVITDTSGGKVTSKAAKLTVKTGPEIVTQPEDVTTAAGSKVIFRVKADGNGLSYQWQWKSGSKAWANTTLSGYNTDTLSFTAQEAHNSRQYRCVVTDAKGKTAESDGATLMIKAGPAITLHPESVSVFAGEKATFKVTASGSGLKYQWQWKSGSKAWVNTTLSGYNTNTLSFASQDAHNGRQYRCVVTDSAGNTNESQAALLTIKPGPGITSQPADVTAAAGETATFKVAAAGSGLKYQWQWKSGSRAWANTTLGGYNTSTLSFTVTSAHNGRQYRCVVTDANGISNESAGATLTVKEGPPITLQPQDVNAVEGDIVTFKIKAGGSSLKYQWQWKSGSRDWANTTLSGYNTDTLSFTAQTALNGRQYRCVVTDAGGISNNSRGAVLTVKASPDITSQPQAVSVYDGDKATFRVSANGSGLKYQWQWKSGSRAWANTTLSGYNTNTLSFTAQTAHNGRQYRCVVTDSAGRTAESNGATLTIKPSPVISAQPKDLTVSAGDKATFKVTASGNGISYQWQWKSGSRDWADTTLAGCNTDTLSFVTQEAHNGRQYRCVVTDRKGVTLASNAATLTVQNTKYRALLIGNDYEGTADELGGCINDSIAMEGMLKSLKNQYTVTRKNEVSASGILSAIPTAFSGATESDVSLFYYSGHGVYDFYDDAETEPTEYTGALCGVDDEYVTVGELANTLSKVPGKIVVIMDSCHSGAAIGKSTGKEEVSRKQLDAFNQSVIDAFSGYKLETKHSQYSRFGEMAQSKFIVITAATYTRSSYDMGDRGQFTSFFLEGLGADYPDGAYTGSMPADKNGDLWITLNEAYTYARDAVTEDCELWGDVDPSPQYYGTGSYVLFKRK